MREAVFLLCALTSVLCAVLLFRRFRRVRTPVAFWSSLCFVGLAMANVLVVVDLMVLPATDLSLVRATLGLGSIMVLLFGLIWHAV